MKTKEEVLKALSALRLEVDSSIVDNITKKFTDYSNEVEGKLLDCARNLGHPAYGLSSSNTIAIDELREQTLDYLDVPKTI